MRCVGAPNNTRLRYSFSKTRLHDHSSHMRLGRGSDKWLIKYLDKSTDAKKLSVTDGRTHQSTDMASYRVACTQLKMNLVTRDPRIALKENK